MKQLASFRALLPLYAVIFLGFFGYALTITLFIPMVMAKHGDLLAASTSTSVRALLSGLLLAMYPLGQFFGSPIIGSLSDHFGRKKTLIVSLVFCTLGFISMALCIQFNHVILLLLSALFTGLCESNMAISQSIIADRATDTAHKTKLIGYAYSACSLGYIVGPLVGGGIGGSLGYSAPFAVTAIAILGLIGWVAYGLHDHYRPSQHTPLRLTQSLTAISSLFRMPELREIYCINFSIFFAVQGLYRVVPLYVVDRWSPSLHLYACLIFFVSVLCFIANTFVLNHLAKRFTTETLLSVLLLLGACLVVLIVVPAHLHAIWFTFGAAVIPTIMALPLCTTWLSEKVSPQQQGQVLGNNQALLVLGESTSAAAGGLIAALFIPLPIMVNGIILMLAGLWVLHYARRRRVIKGQ